LSRNDAASQHPPFSRRHFGAFSLTAAALAAQGGLARAQAPKPLTIGVLNDMSGPTADLSGLGAVLSAELAVEDFGPSVLGRPIRLLKADTQAKADLGVGLARQWYDQDVAAIFDVGITTVAIGRGTRTGSPCSPAPARST